MIGESTLIVVLLVLVGLLAGLLALRIRGEKRRMAVVQGMSLADFSALLSANSKEGAIGQVAGMVSDLLKQSFGCQFILFLRKKRGLLRYNYSYGLKGFNRREFRLVFSRSLADELNTDYFPKGIERLKRFVPEELYSRLIRLGVDTYFPIFWRRNLYGVYFIRSTLETRSASFNLLIASLAQSLSAAYHIKWHEARQENLEKKVSEFASSVKRERAATVRPSSILKLIRHRNSETIVPKIVSSIKTDLGVTRIVFLCEEKGSAAKPVLLQDGPGRELGVPGRSTFTKLVSVLREGGGVRQVDSLSFDDEHLKTWVTALKSSGLQYVTLFSPVPSRAGIMAWGGGQAVSGLEESLQMLQSYAVDLVSNAESYRRVEEMSYTDSLTGLTNQRYLFVRLDEEIARAKRYGRSLALIIFDVDGLKATNDTYGHLAGDAILRQLGQILRDSIRSIDIVSRYGGDEFCVVMPEADRATCLDFMRRLQSAIARAKFKISGVEGSVSCTVCLGGAVFPEHGDESTRLLHAADMALLKGKEGGRNKALLYGEHEEAVGGG